jgi:hypothetical protein
MLALISYSYQLKITKEKKTLCGYYHFGELTIPLQINITPAG